MQALPSVPAWFGVPYALLSLTCSLFASFPYLAYSFGLPEPVWLLTCALRQIMYFVIFSGYWLHLLIDPPRMCRDVRGVIYSTLFAGVYTILYAIKWYTVPKIILREVSVALFVISWFHVFFTMVCQRAKKESIWKDTMRKARLSDHNSLEIYRRLRGEKVDVAESLEMRLSTDRSSSIPLALAGFFGLATVPLTLSLVEDYGYSINLALKLGNESSSLPMSEEAFLWTVGSTMGVFAVMYSSMVLRVACKYAEKARNAQLRCAMMWRSIACIPLIFLAGVLGSIRMNSSYEILGRVVARSESYS